MRRERTITIAGALLSFAALVAMAAATSSGALMDPNDSFVIEWRVRRHVAATPQGVKESYWLAETRARGDQRWDRHEADGIAAEYQTKKEAVEAVVSDLKAQGFTDQVA